MGGAVALVGRRRRRPFVWTTEGTPCRYFRAHARLRYPHTPSPPPATRTTAAGAAEAFGGRDANRSDELGPSSITTSVPPPAVAAMSATPRRWRRPQCGVHAWTSCFPRTGSNDASCGGFQRRTTYLSEQRKLQLASHRSTDDDDPDDDPDDDESDDDHLGTPRGTLLCRTIGAMSGGSEQPKEGGNGERRANRRRRRRRKSIESEGRRTRWTRTRTRWN